MDNSAAFFWTILILQAVFSSAVVVLVARRWPERAPIYRLAAPATLPIMLMLLVSWGLYRMQQAQGLAFDGAPLGRFAIAYMVLWLIGVLVASAMLRLFRR